MYDKYGKTKLFTWFFAFLSMLIIALFLIYQVGFTVDAASVSENENSDNSENSDDSMLATAVSTGNFESFFDITLTGLFTTDGKPIDNISNTITYKNSGAYLYSSTDSGDYSILYNRIKNITLEDTYTISGTLYDIKNQYTNFAIVRVQDGSNLLLLTSSDGEFYGYYPVNAGGSGNGMRIYCSKPMVIFNIGSDSSLSNGRVVGNFSNYSFGSTSNDGQAITRNCVMLSSNNYNKLLLSNCPFLSTQYSSKLDNNSNEVIYVSSNDYDLYYDVFDGTNGSGRPEDAGNNKVMTNADWTFTNSKYVAPYAQGVYSGGNYPTGGNVSFNFTPTEYQKEYPSEFVVKFAFSFDYDVKYQNKNGSVPPFYQTSSITDNWKSTNNIYFLIDDDYATPLSDFISNGNSKSWTWEELFNALENSTFDKSLSGLIAQSREVTSVYYNKFNLNCTAWLDVVSGSHMSESSGFYTEWYNPMSKQGYTTDSTGSSNSNPYIPPTGDSDNQPESGDATPDQDDGNAPGPGGNDGGGSSSSSHASTGNITINNTFSPTNNGGSGGASGGGTTSEASTFYNVFNPVKWMITKLAANNTSTGEELKQSLGVNNWLTLLTDTFGFLPSSFYTNLGLFFTISLGILIIAIIFRIVLDLL